MTNQMEAENENIYLGKKFYLLEKTLCSNSTEEIIGDVSIIMRVRIHVSFSVHIHDNKFEKYFEGLGRNCENIVCIEECI